jgi:hypothetical protein
MKPGRYRLHDGSYITVSTVRYHRNGVGGCGFFAVRFTYRGGDEFIGIVADDGTPARPETFVIDPSNLGNCQRGHDWFGKALERAVASRREEAFDWKDEVRA